MTTEERLAILEIKVELMSATNKDISDKLDSLLELRSKGVGAFWLASGLVGTGIIGFFWALIDWIK